MHRTTSPLIAVASRLLDLRSIVADHAHRLLSASVQVAVDLDRTAYGNVLVHLEMATHQAFAAENLGADGTPAPPSMEQNDNRHHTGSKKP